ncbi:MAG TPA: TonB-dependent receptor, partial [Blastocatellia bacterium]|nr:TonB-dependent receptor [Blastocatellia bacterium]
MKVNLSIFTYFLTCLLMCVCMLCASETAFAQGTNLGTIRGTVTDANGAVVSGAKVQVTDLETSLTREAPTNKEGAYEVTGLKYGAYKVTVTAQGFKTATVNQVALRGGDIVRADAQLQVGGANETVEVSTSANVISLETPTVSGTLNTQQILDLPRDSRDIYSFLYLNPNITQADSDGTFKFIGAQSYGASFTLDGQRSNGGIFGEHTASQPSLEAIGELTVLSNNFSAEYPGIANIRVTTRRGGQDYHGSAFYNNKNSALAAWTLDDKIGQATFAPTTALSKFPTPYFNLNETGGSISGPAPWTKKKTFFFAAYERRWLASPVRFRSSALPHATLLAGDFRKLNDANKPIVPAGVTLTDAELAANTIAVGATRRFVTIPSRLLNPVTAAIIKTYFPVTSADAPINATNGRLTDFFFNLGGLTTRDLGTLRVDQDLSEKNKIYAVYNAQHVTGHTAPVVAPYTGLGLRNDENTNHSLSLSYTRIFSDRLVNEARGGFNRQDQFRLSNTTLRSFLQSAGFNDADVTAYGAVTGGAALDTFGHPAIQLGNYALFSNGGRNTFRPTDQSLVTFGDTLTWIKGRHSIKGGLDFVRNTARDGFVANRGNPRGRINYTGDAVNALTRFLLGAPANTVQYVSSLRPPLEVTNWEHGYFVQDDFKIRPRLTLYLGVRYELITPFVDKNNLMVNFDPNFSGANGRKGRFVVPTADVIPLIDPRMVTYGVVTAKDAGVGRGLVNADTNNVAPRVGVAWALNERTVLRGGYGV